MDPQKQRIKDVILQCSWSSMVPERYKQKSEGKMFGFVHWKAWGHQVEYSLSFQL